MAMASLNYLAILVGAIIFMVLGYLWYGPLFSKPWLAALGKTQEEIAAQGGNMAATYGLTFLGALVTTTVLGIIIYGMGQTTALNGAHMGVLLWVGFVAPSSLGSVLFEGRPSKLYVIHNSYYLVTLALVGALLGAWQ